MTSLDNVEAYVVQMHRSVQLLKEVSANRILQRLYPYHPIRKFTSIPVHQLRIAYKPLRF
ncbi:hypothetical protein IGI04_028433 [Brassica rapa subsp. trilocularis]|uniref:Uncharacterized protein n=1 Tax=Brassica rapa subsp. trilocularis TaxID=1813537 RepID=A0ABQ7L4A2_BRACM|nr:hypothetical protein IGI04_028433 [Brassica rapa subsp. trilocularis]